MPEQPNNPNGETPVSGLSAASNPNPAAAPQTLMGAWQQSIATASAGVMIANSGLPAASRQRLTERTYNSLEEMQQAIEAERNYLAALGPGSGSADRQYRTPLPARFGWAERD